MFDFLRTHLKFELLVFPLFSILNLCCGYILHIHNIMKDA